MFTLLFTRHASNAFEGDERVKVDWESDGRVSVSLERTAPRRGESRPAGLVVVAGDIVRPENAARVVESFLMQVAGAETLQQRINRGLWRRQS